MGIPLGGTSGVFDPRNPTLLPNFDPSIASGSGTVDHQSPAAFLAANPRVNASATATIGGSVTTGDEITIAITNPVFQNINLGNSPSEEISQTYTTVAGDTVTTIAEAIAKLFNDNATAQAIGIEVDAVGAVITFNHPGPVGNMSVLSNPTGEPAKITFGGTATTGDVLTALFSGPQLAGGVAVSITVTSAETTTQMATAMKNAINANAALAALSITATSSAAVVTLAVPAAAEPVTVTAYANTANTTATIGGTVAAGGGDVLTLTTTNTNLTGSPLTLTYTTLAGDTTTTIAAAFATLINTNPALQTVGVEATSAAAVVTITYPTNEGAFTFSESVTSGSETITLLAGPTETLTVATNTTETVTFSNSGKLSGGSGPIIPINNFTFAWERSTQAFWYGIPKILGYNVIQAMVAQGMPIV